jgi:hypothetical protein
MTDAEVLAYYEKLVEYYGDNLANPIHYPRIFENQVKLYRYYNEPKVETENANMQ